MKSRGRIFKIKIEDKATREKDFIISGDNYKLFEDHFLDIVSRFTDKWVYDDSPEGKGKCLGRRMNVKFLEIYEAKERFVSYGGLKMAYEHKYDKEVEAHNKNGNYEACKYLRHIKFEKKPQAYLNKLLKSCRVMEDELA